MTIEIGREYIMIPPIVLEGVDTGGRTITIVEKSDDMLKVMIESLMPHHANGMDWYKTEEGQWGREDWFVEVEE